MNDEFALCIDLAPAAIADLSVFSLVVVWKLASLLASSAPPNKLPATPPKNPPTLPPRGPKKADPIADPTPLPIEA